MNDSNQENSLEIRYEITRICDSDNLSSDNEFEIIELQESDSPLICRICLENNDEELIFPCKCKGTHKYIHASCLDKWRHSNVNSKNYKYCELCKYKYKYYSDNYTFLRCCLLPLIILILIYSYIITIFILTSFYNNGGVYLKYLKENLFYSCFLLSFLKFLFTIFLLCYNTTYFNAYSIYFKTYSFWFFFIICGFIFNTIMGYILLINFEVLHLFSFFNFLIKFNREEKFIYLNYLEKI